MPFYKTSNGGVMHSFFPMDGMKDKETHGGIKPILSDEAWKAVIAERERCAKIVEKFHSNGIPLDSTTKVRSQLAELIRKGE